MPRVFPQKLLSVFPENFGLKILHKAVMKLTKFWFNPLPPSDAVQQQEKKIF